MLTILSHLVRVGQLVFLATSLLCWYFGALASWISQCFVLVHFDCILFFCYIFLRINLLLKYGFLRNFLGISPLCTLWIIPFINEMFCVGKKKKKKNNPNSIFNMSLFLWHKVIIWITPFWMDCMGEGWLQALPLFLRNNHFR